MPFAWYDRMLDARFPLCSSWASCLLFRKNVET